MTLLLLLACTGSGDDTQKTDTADSADTADTVDTSETGGTDDCPIAALSTTSITFDTTAVGSSTTETLTITNDCAGAVDLELGLTVDADVFTLSSPSLTVAPGEAGTVDVTWTPDDPTADSGTLTITTNDTTQPTLTVALAGEVLAGEDADGDGFLPPQDCNDDDADVNPDAEEIWYDGIDQNCDGNDNDQDDDGYQLKDDCDDLDAAVNPDAEETWYDGVDQNCDDNDADQDGDGYLLIDDCDDLDAEVNPDAEEVWYDGKDQNCDGNDNDQDGDGYAAADECNDTDATVNPDAEETWYDGIDQDCDGNDNDQDGDGYAAADDCDDLDPEAYPGATEVWYSGHDEACDGGSDYDQDGDGIDAYPFGVDCADGDATSTDGSPEELDSVDNDCNGLADEGLLPDGAVIVSELMPDPAMVDDSVGQWFELYNTTDLAVDIVGWTVTNSAGEVLTIEHTTRINPGSYVVLGPEGDRSLNGGVGLNYIYDGATFALTAAGDSITLDQAGTTISSLTWDSGWTFTEGTALQLDPSALDATSAADVANWCDATAGYGEGDLGTPGGGNAPC